MADKGAADRTEKPTPKKLEEGRKQGQAPRSPDLVAWAGVLVMTYVLPGAVAGVGDAIRTMLEAMPALMDEPTVEDAMRIAGELIGASSVALIPMLAVLFVTAIAAGVAQGGARPYGARLKPKFARINPGAGFKRMFGAQGAWELVKSLVKTTVVAVLAYRLIMDVSMLVLGSGAIPLSIIISTIGGAALTMVRVVAVAAIVIGVADYLVARRRVMKELMMSRKDIKDEMRQSDGDPMIKGEARRRAMMMSRNRMMAAIPSADVVMVNPTHVAVALKYTAGFGAPRVVAKGRGVIAAKIRKAAADNRVPMVEDIPLARALHSACEVGEEVPAEFYTAVAQVLAFVMGLKAKGAAGGMHRARELALSRR